MSHSEAVERFQRVRSIMETPLLDDRKWSKIPTIPADCFIIDLEDSVVPSRKLEARARALELLAEPSVFGASVVIARPNNLATRWGRDDIEAIAGAGVALMAYPKAQSGREVADVRELLASHGARPGLLPVIETAGALLDVRAIAQEPQIAGLFVGIGDLSVDARMAFRIDGRINPPLDLARHLIAFAAASVRRSATDTLFVEDLRDRAQATAGVLAARRSGFTSLATFYPPHIELINELMRPTSDEVDEAQMVVREYEVAQAEGNPAVLLAGGRTLLALDYQRALQVLALAAADEKEIRA